MVSLPPEPPPYLGSAPLVHPCVHLSLHEATCPCVRPHPPPPSRIQPQVGWGGGDEGGLGVLLPPMAVRSHQPQGEAGGGMEELRVAGSQLGGQDSGRPRGVGTLPVQCLPPLSAMSVSPPPQCRAPPRAMPQPQPWWDAGRPTVLGPGIGPVLAPALLPSCSQLSQRSRDKPQHLGHWEGKGVGRIGMGGHWGAASTPSGCDRDVPKRDVGHLGSERRATFGTTRSSPSSRTHPCCPHPCLHSCPHGCFSWVQQLCGFPDLLVCSRMGALVTAPPPDPLILQQLCWRSFSLLGCGGCWAGGAPGGGREGKAWSETAPSHSGGSGTPPHTCQQVPPPHTGSRRDIGCRLGLWPPQ